MSKKIKGTTTIQRRKRESYKVFLLALPVILYVILFKYIPLWGWIYSFFNYKPGRDLADCTYVGLKNFKALFDNPVLLDNLLRVLKNTFGMQGLMYLLTPLPMFFAIFLSEVKSKKFQKVVQTISTLPHFLSWVIVYSLMLGVLSYNGVVNNLLLEFGLIEKATNYLASSNNVWIKQTFIREWKEIGWSAIVYFAAIAGIDQTLYEAAAVDGAKRMQRIWYITIPQLIPTYFVLLVMNLGKFLNTGIDQYLVFSNPMNKDYLETLDLYVYNLGIGSNQISYSIAVGMMKSVVAIVLFASANWFSKKVRDESIF